MLKIEQLLDAGHILFTGDHAEINEKVTVEDVQKIAARIAEDYKDVKISVKNLFEVMKKAFRELDKHTVLSEDQRREVGSNIIHNIIEINKGHDAGFFTDKALKLLINYSLESVADETLAQRIDESSSESTSSLKISEQESLLRSRIEESINSKNEEIDEIVIPSYSTSKQLERAAVDNKEALKVQVEEAKQYIRETMIEVDYKVAQLQAQLQSKIEQALVLADKAHDEVLNTLEGAQELSHELKEKVALEVHMLAEKIIDAIQKPLVSSMDTNAQSSIESLH